MSSTLLAAILWLTLAKAHGIKLRGHNSRWLAKGDLTPSQLYKVLETYIMTAAGDSRDKVFAWDVLGL